MVGKPRLLSQMHEQISLNTTRFALRESTATVRFWPASARHDRRLSARSGPLKASTEEGPIQTIWRKVQVMPH